MHVGGRFTSTHAHCTHAHCTHTHCAHTQALTDLTNTSHKQIRRLTQSAFELRIEYCWGKAKFQFRRYTNTESPNYDKLEASVRVAMGDKAYIGEDGLQHKAPLPLTQVLRFATRARRYRNAYGCYRTKKEILDAAKQDDDNTTFGLIEAELKESKRHRCTMDRAFVFIVHDAGSEGSGTGSTILPIVREDVASAGEAETHDI